jgi:hypothetical protein
MSGSPILLSFVGGHGIFVEAEVGVITTASLYQSGPDHALLGELQTILHDILLHGTSDALRRRLIA